MGPIFNRFWEIDWVRFLSKIGLDSFSGREGAGGGGGGGHSKAPISLEEGVGKRYKVKGMDVYRFLGNRVPFFSVGPEY